MVVMVMAEVEEDEEEDCESFWNLADGRLNTNFL